MTSFTVNLVPYGQIYTWDRELFLSYFPESTIASALTLDPTTSEINIELPVVTPIAMTYLDIFLRECGDVTLLPADPEALTEAGRYLGIDLLDVLADPSFPEFNVQFYPLILVKPNRLILTYDRLIGFALEQKSLPLLKYIYHHVPANDYEIDKINLMKAVAQGNSNLVKLLLSRVADLMRLIPIEPKPDEGGIAQDEDHPPSHDLTHKYGFDIFGDIDDDLITSIPEGHILFLPLYSGHPDLETIKVLLADPRIQDYQAITLKHADLIHNIDLVRLLLASRQYPREELVKIITMRKENWNRVHSNPVGWDDRWVTAIMTYVPQLKAALLEYDPTLQAEWDN